MLCLAVSNALHQFQLTRPRQRSLLRAYVRAIALGVAAGEMRGRAAWSSRMSNAEAWKAAAAQLIYSDKVKPILRLLYCIEHHLFRTFIITTQPINLDRGAPCRVRRRRI